MLDILLSKSVMFPFSSASGSGQLTSVTWQWAAFKDRQKRSMSSINVFSARGENYGKAQSRLLFIKNEELFSCLSHKKPKLACLVWLLNVERIGNCMWRENLKVPLPSSDRGPGSHPVVVSRRLQLQRDVTEAFQPLPTPSSARQRMGTKNRVTSSYLLKIKKFQEKTCKQVWDFLVLWFRTAGLSSDYSVGADCSYWNKHIKLHRFLFF